MPLDADLLTQSFLSASEREGALMSRFYQLLFTRYPQVQHLFGRNSGRGQEKMLQDTLLAVIEHLDDPTWLSESLATLGATHLDYEVQDHMYPWVGECLVAALAETLADEWTPAHAAAWSEAYGVLSSLALAGAAARRSAEAASA